MDGFDFSSNFQPKFCGLSIMFPCKVTNFTRQTMLGARRNLTEISGADTNMYSYSVQDEVNMFYQ